MAFALLEWLFGRASAEEYSTDPATESELEPLFSTTIRGPREILLTVVVARLLDDGYQASVDFYACHPRPLFEGPIRSSLSQHGIPHGKSGPLNYAKGSQMIDEGWATRRRPRGAAEQVVRLVREVEGMSRVELEGFATVLCARLLREGSRVAGLSVETRPEGDPAQLYGFCERLMRDVPDAGNTPQRIVGLLLNSYHVELQTGLVVTGHEDRASVTSTTSKKPGDINEELPDGTIVHVYEVTLKPFDQARVAESYMTVRGYDSAAGTSTSEVVVVCREEDAHPDATEKHIPVGYLGKVDHEDITYHFVEIYGWVMSELVRMPFDARLAFYESLNEYITHPNTAEAVKRAWRELHEPLRS